jgi:DNA-binding HxlR family transcriptional regulator
VVGISPASHRGRRPTPGALERHITGISTKILNERLRKLEAYGLISKSLQATKPPRTDYTLTPHA